MSGVATAIAASAVVGGVVSNKASKRASETAQETSDAQLAYMRAAENRARADINRLFPQATDRRAQGFQQQMDFLGSALPVTLDAIQSGNVGAQNVLAGAMPQIQNALLGTALPDYSFMQPQTLNLDVRQMLAGVPRVWEQPETRAGAAIPQQPNVPSNPFGRGGNVGGDVRNNFFNMPRMQLR